MSQCMDLRLGFMQCLTGKSMLVSRRSLLSLCRNDEDATLKAYLSVC